MTTEQKYKIKLEWPDKSRLKIAIKLLRAKGSRTTFKLQYLGQHGIGFCYHWVTSNFAMSIFKFFFGARNERTASEQDTISSVTSFITTETKPRSRESNPARKQLWSYHPLWFQSFFAGRSISDIQHAEKAVSCSRECNKGTEKRTTPHHRFLFHTHYQDTILLHIHRTYLSLSIVPRREMNSLCTSRFLNTHLKTQYRMLPRLRTLWNFLQLCSRNIAVAKICIWRLGKQDSACGRGIFAASPNVSDRTLLLPAQGGLYLHQIRSSFLDQCATRWRSKVDI